MYRLVDTHAHLEEVGDLEQALAEARAAGVIAVIAVGSNRESNQKVLALARAHKGLVYPALGLHPWNLGGADIERELEFIEAHIHEAVAVGEIGLDYDKRVRALADKDLQMRVLERLLGIARKHGKPVSVHSRYAWRDAFSLVDRSQVERAAFHWYTGTSGVLRDIIERGYFISANPAVEYHDEHRRAVREAPLERLLLETDSPVVYGRGTDFEYQSRPAHVLRVLAAVAGLKGMDEARIAEATTNNAANLFGL
ncbi:MAG: TatD family hydrolase [Chloroflexi bacterium]|nr:TatD family hydrolase [Chloroflexota bacterium]